MAVVLHTQNCVGQDFWRLGLSPQVTRECGEGAGTVH